MLKSNSARASGGDEMDDEKEGCNKIEEAEDDRTDDADDDDEDDKATVND